MSNAQSLVFQVRRDILRMVHQVNSGHPCGSLGCTEFLVALYHEIMERNEGFDMDGIGEDLFFSLTAIFPHCFGAKWILPGVRISDLS